MHVRTAGRPTRGVSRPAAPPGLAATDFEQVAQQGFGDGANAYVHSMAEFRGTLYAGTSRHSMALLRLFPPPEPTPMDPWPVRVPRSVEDLDMLGQIWSRPVTGGEWRLCHRSPEIEGKNGEPAPRDLGYRGMTVFQGTSDPAPALYVGSISTVLRGCAARLLRSADGETFEPVGQPGLGNDAVSTLRAMTGFDGHLYVPPAGEGITLNSNSASVIMRSADPWRGSWEQACAPGFGDPDNQGIFEIQVFDDHLYAGTFNSAHGYQVWKTPASGGGPCRWTKVVDRGAGRGSENEIAMSMCVFDGALYVGSAVQNGGYDRVNRVGPAACELIRISPDDRVELVMGGPRRTAVGTEEPLSGLGPGFDNLFAGYLWRMVVHEGWLYAATFDWSSFLPYSGNPSLAARRLIERFGADELVRRGGGFELWRTADGTHWYPVTRDGFGNPYNYGARTLVSTSAGLYVGTANPFGPEVAVRTLAGWTYVPNPHGGAEVWLGHRPEPAAAAGPNGGPGGRLADGNHRAPGLLHTPRAPDVLVTGGAGAVGQRLVARLVARGRRVRVLDLVPMEDVAPDLVGRDVDAVRGDVTDSDAVRGAVAGVRSVVHLAGAPEAAAAADFHQVNVRGTRTLLQACADAEVERFVLLSSTAVYTSAEDQRAWPLNERAALGPRSDAWHCTYGWAHLAQERLVGRHTGSGRVVVRSARGYDEDSPFVQELVARALRRDASPNGTDDLVPRQWVHHDDVADVLLRCTEQRFEADLTVLQLAGPEAISQRQLIDLVRRLTRRGTTEPSELSLTVNDRYSMPYDLALLRRLLGFQPRIGPREALPRVLATMRVGDALPLPPAPLARVRELPADRDSLRRRMREAVRS